MVTGWSWYISLSKTGTGACVLNYINILTYIVAYLKRKMFRKRKVLCFLCNTTKLFHRNTNVRTCNMWNFLSMEYFVFKVAGNIYRKWIWWTNFKISLTHFNLTNDIAPGAYSIQKVMFMDKVFFYGWYEDCQNVKLNSTSIFLLIWYLWRYNYSIEVFIVVTIVPTDNQNFSIKGFVVAIILATVLL